MSKLWEVDPETRAKLLDIQKQNGNNVCVDCGAPSPQWASPKFGVFMCLNCSGIHRGLGVHITFIRSVTMDSFKVSEIRRMQLGGNKSWQDFFDAHPDNQLNGKTIQDTTIKERYDSDVGEEWKDRLTAKVEGIEYVPGVKTKDTSAASAAHFSHSRSQSHTPISRGSGTPIRSGSPAVSGGAAGGMGRTSSTRKTQNEAYFALKGQENAQRPDNLPPSQGGKFGGFGSEPMSSRSQDEDWLAEMSKDPLAGLTKGFGWLGKSAKTVYDGSIKPNVQKFADSDFTSQARLTAAQVARDLQATSKTATDSFNRFVENAGAPTSPIMSSSRGGAGPDAEKRDFWDSFGEAPSGPEPAKQDFWDNFGAPANSSTRGTADPPKKDFWESFGEPSATTGPDQDKKDFWDAFSDNGASAAASKRASAAVGTNVMKGGASGAGRKKDDDTWGEW